jgi:hypothetical protein
LVSGVGVGVSDGVELPGVGSAEISGDGVITGVCVGGVDGGGVTVIL